LLQACAKTLHEVRSPKVNPKDGAETIRIAEGEPLVGDDDTAEARSKSYYFICAGRHADEDREGDVFVRQGTDIHDACK
jgi:hypothetical protein